MLINLKAAADKLPSAWRSLVVGTTSNVNIKVLRMDGSTYEAEAHEYTEALIVLDGCLNLSIFGETVAVRSGEMYLVPASVQHGVAAGSQGTLLILDPYLHT